jgi:acyl-CoA synthetase (AMP-forming)/AMP-acid ligase II
MRVPLCIGDYLERSALHGDRIAIVDEPGAPGSLGAISHAELAARARGMARALERMGIAHGERVAIVSPNSARMLIALFGVSAFGRVLVPVNFRLNADEVAYIVGHAEASLVLIDPELAPSLAGVRAPRRLLLDGEEDAELLAPSDEEPTPWAADEDAAASINYTSGTTARPKGVQLTHRNLWLNAAVLGWHTGVREDDVYLHTLPMFHCNGWGYPYGLCAMGGRQVLLRRVDGAEILRRVAAHGVTLMAGPPAVLTAVLGAAAAMEARGEPLPGRGSVRMLLGGAPPDSTLIERAESTLGWEVMHGYGLTETSPLLTLIRASGAWSDLSPAERARRLARQGPPAIGVHVRLSGDGEVLARANHVFAGYWRQPDATAAAFDGDWLHTGDGGRMEGADLVLTDRRKDVIVSGGENVSSIEVEDCLLSHPGIAEAAVIGVPDERWGETVKALVVARPGVELTEGEVIAHARERLAHFKCPTSVELRDGLPRTATGKIQKFLLREPYWRGRERAIN